MERPLVSVIIPAYNLPDYTRKTLQSIVEQEYRPIEVILSDDCSPISLEPLINEFRIFENGSFRIRYYRQKKNLGPYMNAAFVFDKAEGKYLAFMAHDDWYTEKSFISETVELMENTPDCYLCGANSEYENDPSIKMIHLPSWLAPKDKWHIVDGDKYIRILGYHGKDAIGHQSYSAMVLDLNMLRSLGGGFREPYNIDDYTARKLGIETDEGFVCQFLLSSVGSIAISEKIVSVRGRPKDSYSQTAKWGGMVGQALFIIYYNLYKANLIGKYAAAVKKRARETIFHYPVERINLKILRHYHYAPDAIGLMTLSYAKGWFYRYPVYYVALLRRLWQAARRRELSRLVAKHKARGVRGLLAMLFPFRK